MDEREPERLKKQPGFFIKDEAASGNIETISYLSKTSDPYIRRSTAMRNMIRILRILALLLTVLSSGASAGLVN